MSVRVEVERVIGDAIKITEPGLTALTEGTVHLNEDSGAVMDEVVRLRAEILDRCETLDGLLARLG